MNKKSLFFGGAFEIINFIYDPILDGFVQKKKLKKLYLKETF